MSRSLTAKQHAPLTADELEVIRREAGAWGLTPGLFARALILVGLDRLNDESVMQRLTDEKSASRERVTKGARAANSARWGNRAARTTNTKEGE